MKSPALLLSSLLQGCKRLEAGVKGIDRDIITIESRYKHEGDGFFTVALPTLCDALDRGLAEGKFACPTGFKQAKGGELPRLFSGFLCKVFDVITGDLLDDPDIHCIKMIREISRIFKKLQLPDDRDENLDRLAKQKFWDTDIECEREFNVTSDMMYVFQRVCSYILPNIDLFDARELSYKHGPGAVSESVTSNQKWNEVVSQLASLEDLGFDVIHHTVASSSKQITNSPTSSIAKLVTVPKNSTSRRTITVEPCVRMLVQQGYNNLIRDHIKDDGILRQCLALTDQTANQKLALDGSRTGYWATLDLSSASDRLSLRLVELVFQGKPNLLKGLLECRSPQVTDGKTTRDLRKYAGMGNATTFPIQSIVFAVIAITALVCGSQVPTYRNVARAARNVRVYGDDIIIPTHMAPSVIDWITRFGLKVNTDKSFSRGNFRESCGVDAYGGYDVTPVYVRHHPINISKRNPSILAHYVSLSNMFYKRGLYEAANLCSSWVEEALKRPLPLVRDDSGALGLHTRLQASEVHSWDPHLHRPRLKAYCVSSIYRKDVLQGYGALLKFFLSKEVSIDKDHLDRSPVRFRNRIGLRWVAS